MHPGDMTEAQRKAHFEKAKKDAAMTLVLREFTQLGAFPSVEHVVDRCKQFCLEDADILRVLKEITKKHLGFMNSTFTPESWQVYTAMMHLELSSMHGCSEPLILETNALIAVKVIGQQQQHARAQQRAAAGATGEESGSSGREDATRRLPIDEPQVSTETLSDDDGNDIQVHCRDTPPPR